MMTMSSDPAGDPGASGPPAAELTADIRLLFTTRMVRLFAYGLLSIVLVLYLASIGLTLRKIGVLLTLTLIGDTLVSLWLTSVADRAGRRRMLVAGAGLMLFAGVLFASSHNFVLLVIAATLGVISPSGNEIGPFLSIEQAALAQSVDFKRRTHVFAWYNLAGTCATALGALAGGGLVQFLQRAGHSPSTSYSAIVVVYAVFGALLAVLFTRLSPAVELPRAASGPEARVRYGLHRSRGVVARLSALFALDAFGGGFVLQSIVAYWFHQRFGTGPALLGGIFFGANLLAGASALLAARVAARIGLINTMVWTHLPSNLLLMLVPVMPTQGLAITLLLLRFSISQMDVPTRQSYVMAVVDPDERSAAAGVTNVARSVGAAASPSLTGLLLGSAALSSVPFFLSGGLKIVYDLLLYRSFRAVRPSGEEG
jgi:MFS family permease